MDIFHYCAGKFCKAMTRGWVNSFRLRHKNNLMETVIMPKEDAPENILRVFI
jgi:hypothetical protein